MTKIRSRRSDRRRWQRRGVSVSSNTTGIVVDDGTQIHGDGRWIDSLVQRAIAHSDQPMERDHPVFLSHASKPRKGNQSAHDGLLWVAPSGFRGTRTK